MCYWSQLQRLQTISYGFLGILYSGRSALQRATVRTTCVSRSRSYLFIIVVRMLKRNDIINFHHGHVFIFTKAVWSTKITKTLHVQHVEHNCMHVFMHWQRQCSSSPCRCRHICCPLLVHTWRFSFPCGCGSEQHGGWEVHVVNPNIDRSVCIYMYTPHMHINS